MKYINVLTIAGTDPSGGAGIQADLKTFSALRAYGTSVITVLVAQNTCGVQSLYHIDDFFISEQLNSVLDDVRIDAVKIGMLAETKIIEVVAERLKSTNLPFIVFDPVMIAKSGDSLLSTIALTKMRELMLPNVTLITPNLPEAAMLLDSSIAKNEKTMIEQGNALINIGCKAVLIKGGHLNNKESPDWLITKTFQRRFTSRRLNMRNTHGTGCSLSAAITALYPRYGNLLDTITEAKNWLQQAILHSNSLEVGKGIGPIHHFHQWW
ncbi:bifunctional hydroxymethylpyrimidine kinase/phosphomethylpyrimidine kinase [Pantoea sp. Aalb]|uniref:bifunctional hydroxymethylpyrimidine kinase/phosphomethylpyrimidine kinase n=1 Tax=Pantoea sp. Aalb TaxID=2576762 RepID=UPI00132C749F|nr:bifunctional hydroxymethylpyrimidine kinase/phosphomethylpyrimidine kinase [Pantoea sp. Aalb]MXP67327.1 bifunctional hydroxymethylpyrimidine kinase/phosphomethylpyrimidine kinase [Pantoea sp. Aalb]